MGKGNEFRQPRRRGFDDDLFPMHTSASGRRRPNIASAPGLADELPSEATMKWFNPEKGFGFVTRTQREGDAFLHVSVLQRRAGNRWLRAPNYASRSRWDQRGPQVARILEIDESRAVDEPSRRQRLASPFREQAAVDSSSATEISGTVKWFNVDKGFGFIGADDEGRDIFIHISVVGRAGIDELTDGQRVTMGVVDAPKGREAISVALVGKFRQR
jgi:cold shock protein